MAEMWEAVSTTYNGHINTYPTLQDLLFPKQLFPVWDFGKKIASLLRKIANHSEISMVFQQGMSFGKLSNPYVVLSPVML